MSPNTNIHLNAAGVDLGPRVQRTATVVASPAAATETIIASLTIAGNLATSVGVFLFGFAAFTVGASGVGVNLKLHVTDASGTTLKATGILTYAAADLGALSIQGLHTTPAIPGQVYVMTATVASGAAESTVSAVELVALVV